MTRWRLRDLFGLLAVAIGLAACAPYDSSHLQVDPTETQTSKSVQTIYSDRTMITFGPHGTQIEYHRPDGISFLWYPGNTGIVPAYWHTRTKILRKSSLHKPTEHHYRGHEICWLYPSYSYNPLTRQSGGKWKCAPDRSYFSGVREILQGAPFNLATGRVPFRLEKGEITAVELITRAGGSAADLTFVFQEVRP